MLQEMCHLPEYFNPSQPPLNRVIQAGDRYSACFFRTFDKRTHQSSRVSLTRCNRINRSKPISAALITG